MDFEKDLKTAEKLSSNIEKQRFWSKKLYHAEKYIKNPLLADLRDNTKIYIEAVKREIEYLKYELPIKNEQVQLHENTFSKSEKESLNNTFNKIKNGWLSELEQINFIEEITDNYNLEKLKALEHDVSFYIFMEKEERLAEITEEEKEKKFNEYWKKGKRLPTLRPPIKFNSFDEKTIKSDKWELKKWELDVPPNHFYSIPYKFDIVGSNVGLFRMRVSISRAINMEKLFFPYEFWLIKNFEKVVQTKKVQVSTEGKSWLGKTKLQDLQSNDSLSFPNPKEIAEQYHTEKGSKNIEYSADQIAPVMEVAKNYVEENGITKLYGHIKAIRGKCNGLDGKRDAKTNWIKFYAEKAGLKLK